MRSSGGRLRAGQRAEVVVVTGVIPGAPADGRVKPGDELLEVGGQPFAPDSNLGELVQASQGMPLTVGVRRAEASLDFQVIPVLDEGRYRIGVGLFSTHKPREVTWPYALSMAAATPLATARERFSEVAEVIRGDQKGELVGPVGIVVGIVEVPEGWGPPGWVTLCGLLARLAVTVGLELLLFDAAWIFVRAPAPGGASALPESHPQS